MHKEDFSLGCLCITISILIILGFLYLLALRMGWI